MDPNGQLMDIGTVAAANIARALELPEAKVGVIRQAIRDEISAMSTHFTLAFADIQTQYEIQTNKVESENAAVHTTLRVDADKMRQQYDDNVTKLRNDFDAALKEIRSTFKYARENWVLISATLLVSFLLGSLAEFLI